MIPLRDNIPSRTTPVVNYSLMAVCAGVFLLQVLTERNPEVRLVERLGMIPARVLDPDAVIPVAEIGVARGQVVEVERAAASTPFPPWLTLLTCIFLHGGWMHFLGNVWFLHIFGDNVEDRIGHVGYLLFYLGSGVAASAVHLAAGTTSTVPTIGASGAIAGVMGAYMLLYPRSMIESVVPIVYFMQVVVLPAPVFLGIWFVIQLFQGTMMSGASGVAWWAHIGGFVAGFLVAVGLRSVGETSPPVTETRPNADRVSAYRYRRLR